MVLAEPDQMGRWPSSPGSSAQTVTYMGVARAGSQGLRKYLLLSAWCVCACKARQGSLPSSSKAWGLLEQSLFQDLVGLQL